MITSDGVRTELGPRAGDGSRMDRRRLLWIMLLRVGLISALLSATIAVNIGGSGSLGDPTPRFLLVLIAVTYVASIIYSLWYRAGRRLDLLTRLQLGVDTLFWGCLVYATGGIASGFTFLFDLWVIVAAIVVGGRAAYTSAAYSVAVLAAMAGAMFFGVLPPLADQPTPSLTTGSTAYFFGVNAVALFIVAWLVTSLVSRLERAGRGLEHERAKRADLAVLHADIIRSLTVGLATTGSGGEILAINPTGREILGLVDSPVSERLDRYIPDLTSALVGDAAEARGHGLALASDGARIPIDYTTAPLLNAEGVRHGSIVIFNDLTKVKRLEAALEKARHLAGLGELAASLAHEIRNPLSAVSGSFQMLAARPDFNEEDRSLVQIVVREVARMERLVTDMLEYARPREPELRAVELGAVVGEVVRAFMTGREAEGRDVEFASDEAVLARADQAQIRQVVWNLLRNAAQVTDDGGSVRVVVERDPESGDSVVAVADDGPGIPERDRIRIFEPFFSTRERGLGLGLAICKRIVDAHGGAIRVGPGDGGGTIFEIRLPAADRPDEER
jgi:two-component system, NtrC family, sensor histidine kinase PilS